MTIKQELTRSTDDLQKGLHPHQFATRHFMIRQALANHRQWIEEQLGVPLSEAVVFEGLTNLSQIGVDKLLSMSDLRSSGKPEQRRLRTLVEQAKLPPQCPPILDLVHNLRTGVSLENLLQDRQNNRLDIEWMDCPVALRLHHYNCTIVTMNMPLHSGPGSQGEHTARLLVVQRDCASKVVELLEMLYRRDGTPRLHTLHDKARRISLLDWDDLVLDANVITLLKIDFETFWERATFYRERKLPFRRGYLLHGPPGNGKTSVVRAMMSSRRLNAYTMRFFDPRVEDSDLDDVFNDAYRDRPAMVLLEDIDRVFPKVGESRSKISLQHLLNCLDGVATQEGIMVVATGNDPAALDPAILRRPGRFDRVVCFPNPGPELRLEYLRRMNMGLDPHQLEKPVRDSSGFSFAQLRESYILSCQRAFERGSEISEEDLLAGIRSLRGSMIRSAHRSGSAGFGASDEGV